MQHLFLFTRSLAKLPLLEKVNSIFQRGQKKEEEEDEKDKEEEKREWGIFRSW